MGSSSVKKESAIVAQVPVKRMRTSKPKTKTGCRNCKQRRIKCDEQRPACTQCTRSKKICTGYPPPVHSDRRILLAPKPIAPAPASAPIALAAAPAIPIINPIRTSIPLPPRRAPRVHRQPASPPDSPENAPSVVLYQRPSQTLSFDIREGQYFQLFRSNTAAELSGFFDNVFWTKTVLQECHGSPAVKHAVVALGALYKTLEKSTESPPSSPSSDDNNIGSPRGTEGAYPHWEVAVQQYGKACHAQREAIMGGNEGSNRTCLMTSVLLTCFDSFIGDHKQAIVQIQNGLGLLEKLRIERRRAAMSRPEEPVEDELIQMFTRLAIQAKSYDMAFHFPEPYVIHLVQKPADASSPVETSSPVSTHQEPIPDRFSSLIEARIAWDTLCEQCFRAMESMAQFANGPPNLLPQSMMVYGRAFAARIQKWSDAFDHILAARTAPGISSQEKAGIAVLKMFQIMGQILYLMTFSDSEMQFDSFRTHFEAIVKLALEVVGDEERRAAERRCPHRQFCQHHVHHHGRFGSTDIFGGHEYTANHIKPSFSADLGIVPPLYVVAAKSRDPVIRRQAIQLLRSSARREGMWDSELTAQIGMWIMELEESGMNNAENDEDGVYSQDTLLTPQESPVAVSHASFSTQGSRIADFDDDTPLGPGGNARWQVRPGSSSSASVRAGSVVNSADGMASLLARPVVPAEKRILITSAEFDLREHTAVLRCGTRGLHAGVPDTKLRETRIVW